MGTEFPLALDHVSPYLAWPRAQYSQVVQLGHSGYHIDSDLFASSIVLAYRSRDCLWLDDHKEEKESNYDCNLLTDWNLAK